MRTPVSSFFGVALTEFARNAVELSFIGSEINERINARVAISGTFSRKPFMANPRPVYGIGFLPCIFSPKVSTA